MGNISLIRKAPVMFKETAAGKNRKLKKHGQKFDIRTHMTQELKEIGV